MNSRIAFRVVCLSVVLSFGSLATLAPVEVAAQSKPAKPNKVSAKVGKPLSAALEAAKAKQFDVAETKLKEAEAVEKKTPFDEFSIADIAAFIYLSQQKYGETATAYEKMLTMPEFLVPANHENLVKRIAVFHFQTKDYTRTIEFGKRWLQDHPDDVEIHDLVGQAYYQLKDFKQTREYMSNAVAVSEREGKAPKELWFRYIQNCSVELDDEAGITEVYQKMARYYPKPETWERLLGRLSLRENNERVMLQWLRLAADVGALKRADQYAEYVQLAMESALPGEAARIAEAGYELKVLGADPKEQQNHQRLRDRAKAGAQTDRSQLPQLEKEAQAANATAGAIAGLGLAYFSFEQYDKAVASLEAGLKKGGLKNPDEYVFALGVSQYRLGQKEQARETFKSVAADSPLAKVASTWVIRTYN